jgi:hypothetical protein
MLNDKQIFQEAEKEVSKAFLVIKFFELDKKREEALKRLFIKVYSVVFKNGYEKKQKEGGVL